MSAFIDLTGQRFGKLVVLEQAGKSNNGKILWLCKCDCSNEKIILGNSLASNRTKSCGCLYDAINLKHGHAKKGKNSKTYKAWSKMNERCRDLTDKNYGNRGVVVCERWLPKNNGFVNFLKDMGECPPGLTLDRINNNKNYCPGNCRWTTQKEQTRNRRNTLYINYIGNRTPLIEVAEESNIPYPTLYYRIIIANWSIKKALSTPVKRRK